MNRIGRRGRRLRGKGLVDGPLCKYVRGRDCCVPTCREPGQPHHVDHAGLRMDWLVDRRDGTQMTANVSPLCWRHHRELHDIGRPVFEWEYNLNLADVARYWGARFMAERPAEYHRILTAA